MKHILLSVAPAAVLALLASPALSAPLVAADIDGGLAVGHAASWHSATFGMTARAGYEFDLSNKFFLGPEAGVGYMIAANADGIADAPSVLPSEPEIVRLFGGLRGGFRGGDDDRVVSSLFARGGYAWITGGSERSTHAEAPVLDIGFAIDYALPPVLRIGGHAGFETLWAKGFRGGPFTGIHAGIAFTFVFSGQERPASETVAAR
ncbi:autotransporter domain-containing protein [Sorangium sp. So ce233]|uniref:autotransporter domain-containing protein n=1 Tax=Sorangium sp. So ce233 TaxID=3133290 RepID=UPI003F628AB6